MIFTQYLLLRWEVLTCPQFNMTSFWLGLECVDHNLGMAFSGSCRRLDFQSWFPNVVPLGHGHVA